VIRTNKKRHRSIEVADPNLGGASVEIQGALFVHFGLSIGRRKNLDTDFRGRGEQNRSFDEFSPSRGEPDDIDGFDTVSGGEWTLGQSAAVRKEISKEISDVSLAICVGERWRRTHKDTAKPIGLKPIRELRELGVSKEFAPASQVEHGLRLEIRELHAGRHAGKIRRKWEKA
jgi:hypothetical protein